MRGILTLYFIGVLIGFWRTDATLLTRLALAVLWPIGPLAFVVTVAVLIAASPFAFIRR
jgi:predicted branched-subunit amino acid permease